MIEVEAKQRKDGIEDALNAIKLAYSDGVAVGGIALLRLSKRCKRRSLQKMFALALKPLKALRAPSKQMFANASLDTTLIVNNVLQSNEETMPRCFNWSLWQMFVMKITDSIEVTKTGFACSISLRSLNR
ncbi:MAG: hypothetical protein ACTS6A_01680 [Candidatus Hodgkinia cicadicola]